MKVPSFRVSLVAESSVEAAPEPVNTPKAAVDFLRSFLPMDDEREHFYVLLLDAKNKLKGYNLVSLGTLTCSLVHPREVFRPAIVAGAASVVIAHNHPSGDPTPSNEDGEVTKRLKDAGKLLGIQVLDHVILGSENRYYSFSDKREV